MVMQVGGQAGALHAPPAQAATLAPINLHDLWNIMQRRRALIAATMATVFVLALLYCLVATKYYTAEMEILIENQQKNVKIDAVTPDQPLDMTAVPSEMEVLTSRNLMGAVIDRMKLMDHPELVYPPQSIIQRTTGMVKGWFASPPTPEQMKLAQIRRRDAMIDTLLRYLKVKQGEKSRGIDLTFEARDPVFAADFLNTLGDVYIEQQVARRYDSIRITNQWLSDRVAELRKKVQDADQAAVQFQAQNGLIESRNTGGVNGGVDLIQQNISELSSKLTAANADLAEADANLVEISDPKKIDAAPAVLASPLIQKLRDREADVQDDLAQISKDLGPGHPKIIAEKAEVRQIQQKINAEVAKIARGIQKQRDVAAENVQQLQDQLAKLKTDYNQYMSNSVQATALDSEAQANHTLLDTLNARWKETQAQEDVRFQPADARIISSAAVPGKPSSPKTPIILAAALIAGLGLGAGLAVGMDQLQTGIYNGKQLQGLTHVANIALVPTAHKAAGMHNLADYPLLAPDSPYIESIRSITGFLRLKAANGTAQRLVNFTGAGNAEGKSTLVACVARQMAIEGFKVVAIDCDRRDGALGQMFGIGDQPGLSNYLEGGVPLSGIVNKDKSTGLAVIGGGTLSDANIIARRIDAWKSLVKSLGEQYDFILLDTAPVVDIADSKLIAKESSNILCVRWQKTPVKQIMFALDVLHRLDCALVGTVVTMTENQDSKA